MRSRSSYPRTVFKSCWFIDLILLRCCWKFLLAVKYNPGLKDIIGNQDRMAGRYTLEQQLGKGAMGVVYRAFDNLERRYVALKQVEVDPLTMEMNPLIVSPRYRHMLLTHEFRTLASLRHPNIVSVIDYGFSAERHPFFVMELLEHPLTIVEAADGCDTQGKVDLLIQLLQALVYLHHHRTLHRDLKPANVLVTVEGQVKVLDFGLAVKVDEHQERGGT